MLAGDLLGSGEKRLEEVGRRLSGGVVVRALEVFGDLERPDVPRVDPGVPEEGEQLLMKFMAEMRRLGYEEPPPLAA